MRTRTALAFASPLLALAWVAAAAQDMMRHVDLNSPEMTTAEMSRSEIEAAIAAATPARAVDLTGRKLSGLDLSGLDLSGAVLRAAKLTGRNLPAQSSTTRSSTRPGLRPISLGQASRAPACLPRKCSARSSMAPTFPARALRLT